MPVRNIVKTYGADQFYHVYSRGVGKQPIFKVAEDYDYFISLFARYLSVSPTKNVSRVPYPHFGNRLDLLAYCLMPNHVHLLVYQSDEHAMTECMKALFTSYSMYFNKKYDRSGHLFESNYLASLIDRDDYLEHISRYIHLNPAGWQKYPYSSFPFYSQKTTAEWIKPEKIMAIFNDDVEQYIQFLKDYEAQKWMLDELKHELAHS